MIRQRLKLISALLGPLLLMVLVAFWMNWQPAADVRGKTAALPLTHEQSPVQQLAQDLALSDPRVQALTLGRRSEVFGVRRMGQQWTQASRACATAVCYQVEIYSFAANTTVLALVDTDAGAVLDVLTLPDMQPGINRRLADLALEIALNDPGVIEALGFRPQAADMAPVAAGMEDTSCEQGHLCAGPTFRVGNHILWAVVDLTEERVAGLSWTAVSPDGESETRPAGDFCPDPGSVNRDGWSVAYETTGTDGFRVYDVTYQGRPVLTSATLVEWHVDYNGTYTFQGFIDVTGCSGTGGGFSIAPYGQTQLLPLMDGGVEVGFELVQDFRMSDWGAACNYRYGQRMQFWADGRFRIVSGAYGRGCGDSDTLPQPVYRPVLRIDVAVLGDAVDSFAVWDGTQWAAQPTETYRTPYAETGHGPHQFTSEGYVARITDIFGAGYTIEPGQGQFGDNGRGDAPFLYVTQHKEAEGDVDFPIFGSNYCCNDNHLQGPDLFVDGESIANTNLVLWYVPQMGTDRVPVEGDGDGRYCWTVNGEPNPETYPCFAGPMFVPFNLDVAIEDAFLPLVHKP